MRQPYGSENPKKGAVEAKPEVEIWRRPDFLTRRLPIRLPIHYGVYLTPLRSFRVLNQKQAKVHNYFRFCKSTSGVTTVILFHEFLPIIVNFTTFWAISDTFETTSGFRLLLPVHKFRLVSPDFHIGSISYRLSAILQPYGPEYGKKERPVGPSGQTGSRNMAEASFSDSATPTSYSTSYTLWSLSRTVTAPPGENFNISPL